MNHSDVETTTPWYPDSTKSIPDYTSPIPEYSTSTWYPEYSSTDYWTTWSGVNKEENEEEVIDEYETTTIQFETMESINEDPSKNLTVTSTKKSSSDRQEFQYFGWGTRYDTHKSETGVILN